MPASLIAWSEYRYYRLNSRDTLSEKFFTSPANACYIAHGPRPLRLAIVDHCSMLSHRWDRALVNQKLIQVVGLASHPDELFYEVNVAYIDVALVAVDFPDGCGIEICRWISLEYPDTKTVLISSYNWDSVIIAALYLHAAGVLLRNQPTSQIIQGLLQAAERPIFTLDQLRQMRSWESRVGCKLHSLRGREWEILKMILEGLAFRRMARRLSLSQGELDELLASLLRKLGLLSQSQLLTYCFEEHLDILVSLSSQLNQPPFPV